MKLHVLQCTLWLVVSLAPSLAAQERATIPIGTRVRVTRTDQTQLVGEAVNMRGDTLWAATSRDSAAVPVPLNTIRTLERPRLHRHAGRGALIGLLAGVALGLAVPNCSPSEMFCPASEAVGDGLAGAGLGALVGAAIRTQSGWEPVPLVGLRLGVAPLRGRLGLGAALAL
jgi:hypothetical protein